MKTDQLTFNDLPAVVGELCDRIASMENLLTEKLSKQHEVKENYEGENETYIEASAENSGSTLYDKEIRDKPRTRHTKRNV